MTTYLVNIRVHDQILLQKQIQIMYSTETSSEIPKKNDMTTMYWYLKLSYILIIPCSVIRRHPYKFMVTVILFE
jgi:hypothetical protein